MNPEKVEFYKVESADRFPEWITRDQIVVFFHETMKPYEDRLDDIQTALDNAFSKEPGKGGFLMLAHFNGKLAGALLMLKTGMKGFVPENILLFVSVSPAMRGKGIGGRLCKYSIEEADGDVKLHVEYDNPARRLYERLGMTTKYAEMRYIK